MDDPKYNMERTSQDFLASKTNMDEVLYLGSIFEILK